MKEVKYRAYIKEDDTIVDVTMIDFGDKYIEVDMGDYFEEFNFERVVILQFSGIKDKHGVDIYEGDIVQYEHGEYHAGFWQYYGTFIIGDVREYYLKLREIPNLKVIGNIYEGSELFPS